MILPSVIVCAYPAANLYPDAFKSHLTEISSSGFNTILLCCPESYVLYSLPTVHTLIRLTHTAGLDCWVDPWGLRPFDGEALCDHRRVLEEAIHWWITAIAQAPDEASRPDAIFLDNPDPTQLGIPEGAEARQLPDRIQAWAVHTKGYGLGVQVCLSADRHRKDWIDLFPRVADLDMVDGLWTDPYRLGPPRPWDAEGFVGEWAGRIARIGTKTGKLTGVWVQTFGLAKGEEDFPIRAAQTAVAYHLGGIGIWCFRAAETWIARPGTRSGCGRE